jgi:hypothetical protein
MSDATERRRAKRYALECPVRFRDAGAEAWREGRLRNISESGLLFDPCAEVADAAQFEIGIQLPPPGIGAIWCRAIVARRNSGTGEIAARITDYRLMPRGTSAEPSSPAF